MILSEFKLIIAGRPDPERCTARGNGLANARAGVQSEFEVLVRTRHGEPVSVEQGVLKVEVSSTTADLPNFRGSSVVYGDVAERSTGSFVASFAPEKAGLSSIAVML